MAYLLRRLGKAALQSRVVDGQVLPPLVSFQDAMRLREQFYRDGRPWPFEDIVPGPPQAPPGSQNYLRRQAAKEAKRLQREKEIQEAMKRMPQLVADYRASRRLNWDEVTPLDRLTLSIGQIREKYIKKRAPRAVGVPRGGPSRGDWTDRGGGSKCELLIRAPDSPGPAPGPP